MRSLFARTKFIVTDTVTVFVVRHRRRGGLLELLGAIRICSEPGIVSLGGLAPDALVLVAALLIGAGIYRPALRETRRDAQATR